jgi:hypothetical protein
VISIAEMIVILDTEYLLDKNYVITALKEKNGSHCTGIVTFMEELFSLAILQIYPCNNGRIYETRERHLPD